MGAGRGAEGKTHRSSRGLARFLHARVSLPLALAAAVLCFVLGRLTLARPPAVRPAFASGPPRVR